MHLDWDLHSFPVMRSDAENKWFFFFQLFQFRYDEILNKLLKWPLHLISYQSLWEFFSLKTYPLLGLNKCFKKNAKQICFNRSVLSTAPFNRQISVYSSGLPAKHRQATFKAPTEFSRLPPIDFSVIWKRRYVTCP